MRALFLNHNVVGTGTYQRASNFARELAQLGHHITLITTSRRRRLLAEERTDGLLRVIEAPDLLPGSARTGWDVWNTLWRTRRVAPEEFDLVHAFDCRPAVLLPALTQQRRAAALFFDWADWWGRGGTINERSGPLVRTMFGPIETWFEESFRARATANTTISDALRARCIALGVPAERVLLVPEGCAAPRASRPDRAGARRALGLGNEPLLAHVGVTQPADAQLLMEAFRMLRARLPAVRLVLIGNFRTPTPADLATAVRRTGYLTKDELQLWLAAADAGVVPLRDTIASRGRWPGKVSEYLTAGLPTVLPQVGDAARIIAAARAGCVCEPTPASLAAALEQLLGDDSARAELANNARALAMGALSWRVLTQRLLAFYAQWTQTGVSIQPMQEGAA